MLLARSQVPSVAAAQALQAPIAAAASAASASAAAPKAALVAKAPSDWIRFDDASYTPVVDDVSQHLADARLALSKEEGVKAAEAMRAAARTLSAQADRADAADQHRAAADVKLALDTHTRMAALVKKLDATAAQVEAGKLTTTAQLDKTFNKAARAPISNAAGWSPRPPSGIRLRESRSGTSVQRPRRRLARITGPPRPKCARASRTCGSNQRVPSAT